MFVAVDIGNTNVTCGFFKSGSLAGVFRFETAALGLPKSAEKILKKKAGGFLSRAPEAVYICSVVPKLNERARRIFKGVFGVRPCVIGEDVSVPIINRYRIPSQVGQDRLVNAYAGLKLYGPGLIIVDFGTAITFDILSKKSEYLGGLITPGLRIMQESLHKKTALLPYVELSRPIEIFGRDTVSSIRAGLIYGTAGLCDGIIGKLLKKDCKGFRVIATGGDALLLKPHSGHLSVAEEHLILKGLYLIFKSQN